MPATLNGSPTHLLIVHIVVVLLPISVAAALALVFVPSSRRAFAVLNVLVAFVACVAIPLAFLSGSKLEALVPSSPLIRRHVQLAHELLPLAAAFGLVLFAFVVLDMIHRANAGRLNVVEDRIGGESLRRYGRRHQSRWPYRVAAGLLVLLSVATGFQVYRVGDAGAKAAWAGRLQQQGPLSR